MLSGQQFYPDEILLAASVTDENLQAAMKYLLSGKATPGCKIRLNENHFTLAQTDILLKALADARCPADVEIFLDHCHLTNAHANKFAELFEIGNYPRNLRVHLFGNFIGDNGAFAMVDALKRDPERPGVFLNLGLNQNLTNEFVQALTTLIAMNQLTDGVGIDISENAQLQSAPLVQLLEVLQRNAAVTELGMDIPFHDFNDDFLADREIVMAATQIAIDRRAQLNFCCERNRLLQKHRGNPDFIYQIYRLSEQHGMVLPRPEMDGNRVPSLSFFAANRMMHADINAFLNRYQDGWESLRELTTNMQNIDNKLYAYGKSRGCPWPCTIL